ncbi:MAG: beta-ketoacyl-ACP synthase III [Proteobacteria bacterium]|nr:beta-ketoacyl-ACP synthase III [Pseudomonadota bacterium]
MNSTGTAITGSGVWTPDSIVTNEELCTAFNEFVRRENERDARAIAAGEKEPLLESSPEFIVKASGIKRRYVQDRTGLLDPDRLVPNIASRPDDQMSYQCEYSVRAAERALVAAGRHAEDIDLVICSVCNIERAYPAISIEVQDALGTRGYGYDMQVGCSSMTYAIRSATEAIRCGSATRVLIVTPELTTGHMNFKDRDSHFIFGDAGVALVIEALDLVRGDARGDRQHDDGRQDAFEIVSTRAFTRFSSNIRNNGGYLNRCDPAHQFDSDKLFYQQGRRVFKDIVPLVTRFVTDHLAAHDLESTQVSRYWLHQANINMNNLIAKRLLGREPSAKLAPIILDEYANTASAGSLIAFNNHHDDLAVGDYGVICSFGAGYSIGSVLVRRM